jgi:hypothetical protein
MRPVYAVATGIQPGLVAFVLKGGRAFSLRGTNRHQKDGPSKTERQAITNSVVPDMKIILLIMPESPRFSHDANRAMARSNVSSNLGCVVGSA